MFAALLVLVLVVVAYAWIDGGREPVHFVTQPVAVPADEPALGRGGTA